ncbi:MAG: phosphatase PAP2 family protein [Solirubrobacteraceae bacterium]
MSRRAAITLTGGGLAVALLILTWFLTFHVGFFARADVNILTGFLDLRRPRVSPIASFIAHLCNPQPYAYLVAVPILLALARRRPGVGLMIGAVVLGANLTTQLLKPLLHGPRLTIPGGMPIIASSWPSGHATAAMTLALCSVIAAPARLRPALAATGAAFSVAVSYSFLTLGWHYPSDVFGGFLVATAWTLLGAGTLFALDARRGHQPQGLHHRRPSLGEALRAPAAAGLGALAMGVVILLARPRAVLSYADAHTTFVVGAAAIGALSLALATGLMLALRR